MEQNHRADKSFTKIYQITLEDGAHRLATKSFAPGKKRLWRASDSMVLNIVSGMHLEASWQVLFLKASKCLILPSHKVLYLGAASGTTPSHVSDIVGENGHVYCVEFAQRSLRELVTNVITYRPKMTISCGCTHAPKILCSSPAKLTIFTVMLQRQSKLKFSTANADVMLKAGGWVMLAVKSQSIDVSKAPSEIYRQEACILENRGFRIEQVVDL